MGLLKKLTIIQLWFICGLVHATDIELWHAHQAHGFIETLVKNFTQQSGVQIKITPFDPAIMKGELMLGAASGSSPDIILVPSDFLGIHHELNLTALDPSWNDPELAPSALQTTLVAGKQYGVPVIQGNHLMLFYNKLIVSKPARNWETLHSQQAKLAEQQVKTIGWNYNEMYWFIPFLGAFDGWPIEGENVTLNTEAMREALRFYQNLSEQGLIPKECGYSCAQKEFIAGKFAYSINGDWAYSDFKQALGDKLGVTLLPKIGNKNLVSMSSSFALAFPGMQPQSQTAIILKQLARYFQSAEQQALIYDRYRLLPVNQRIFAQIKASAEGDDKVILSQLALARAMPNAPAMAIIWEAIYKGYKRFMEHGYSADRAAEYMQRLADTEIAKLKEN
jgi:maltose-binding protein MalE